MSYIRISILYKSILQTILFDSYIKDSKETPRFIICVTKEFSRFLSYVNVLKYVYMKNYFIPSKITQKI